MKKIYPILLLSFSLTLVAQAQNPKNAPLTKVTKFDNDSKHYIVYAYTPDSTLIRKSSFSDKELTNQDGPEEFYYSNGQVSTQLNYANGKRSGDQKSFKSTGGLTRNEKYIDGERTEGKCYDGSGNEIPYFEMETKPQYPGGTQKLYEYIGKNFRRGRSKEYGKIIVSFIVEKDGSVQDAKIVKGLNPELDNEAIRLVTGMERWSPGKQNGKPVRVQYSLPINIPK